MLFTMKETRFIFHAIHSILINKIKKKRNTCMVDARIPANGILLATTHVHGS